MGVEKGMGGKCNTVKLYSVQTNSLIKIIEKHGACFSKKDFIISKYEESAPIFVAAYSWFSKEADKIVPRPDKAEFPYWAFTDMKNLEKFSDSSILELYVPINEVVFFNMYDWNKILKLQYIGESENEEKNFRSLLSEYGIKHDSDLILTNFYPELKKQVMDSWSHLFFYHNQIKNGNFSCVQSVQAALWQIRYEWINNIIN